MLTIGSGQAAGCRPGPQAGPARAARSSFPKSAPSCSSKRRSCLGVAILENAREETARIVAVEPEDILEVEPRLLDEARTLMARLPFDQIDVLVVGELGKNYSGTGLDPNVIGRQRVETMPDLPTPVITRLAVLDLSHETRGNALGIGLADLTTDRLVRSIDPTPMRVNSLTSNFLTRARVPLALPTDRDVIATSLDTCWRIDAAAGPDGADPEHAGADHALGHACARGRGRGIIRSSRFETDFRPIPFDQEGNLEQEELFPESQRARRHTVLIRAVVFDLDGLMFDTEALFFRVASEALADRGKVFTPEIMRQLIGRRAAEVAQSWKTLAGVEEPVEDFLADVRERFYAEVDTAVHPMPGLFVLLDRLHTRWRSGRGGDLVAARLRRSPADPPRPAEPVRVRARVRRRDAGKPDPEIYRLPPGDSACRPASMLVLEDSPAGLAAAKGAGAVAVGVPHEHSPRRGTRRRRPDRRPARRSFPSSPDRIPRRETSNPMSHSTDPADRAPGRAPTKGTPGAAAASTTTTTADILPYVVPMFAYVGSDGSGRLPAATPGQASHGALPDCLRRSSWSGRPALPGIIARPGTIFGRARARQDRARRPHRLVVCAAWVGLDGLYPHLKFSGKPLRI